MGCLKRKILRNYLTITAKTAFTQKICLFLTPALLFVASIAWGQAKTDTVKLDIKAAEDRFVHQNMAILAAKYDVEIAKTNILQAQLWYNPNLTYGQTLYNYSTHKLFDVSNNDNGTGNGELYLQLQQLISYAGRHTNLVKLNKIDADRAQYVFEEVVRSLKLELYNDFGTLYADQRKAALFASQIKALNNLIQSTEEQLKLGVSSKNDLVRLKAERQDDQSQLLQVQSELLDAETDVKTLLHYPIGTFVVTESDLPKMSQELPPLVNLLNTAQNRGDLKLANKTVDYESQNLKLQKSLAVPDLNIGAEYDRAAGAGYNYTGISLSSDIPVFNRNQGAVLAAKYSIEKAKLNDSLQYFTVRNQVEGAYAKLLQNKMAFESLDKGYEADLEELATNAVNNYNKKLISLLEFLDQIRSYTSAKAAFIEMNANYFNAIQNLNYQVGSDTIK